MAFQEFTPIQYLMIDIANNAGQDKEDWDLRLQWFEIHEAQIREIAELAQTAPKSIPSHPLVKYAKENGEPSLFVAGILAWDAARQGKEIGYPISLDATASGAQLLALLVECEKSALLCNVIDSGKREDLYTNVYHLMLGRMPDQAISITRQQVKDAVMPSFYGSREAPIRTFGEGERLQCFYDTMSQDLPGLWALNNALIELWNPRTRAHSWVLPDNFHVRTKVMDEREEHVQFAGALHVVTTKVNRPKPFGLDIAANSIHSIDGMVVREMSRRCSYNPDKIAALIRLTSGISPHRPNRNSPNHDLVETLWQHYLDSGFLSARILELLDPQNIHLVDADVIRGMIKTLPEKPFPILSVHDCFRCHPNYGNDLRRQYNQILHDMAQSDLLSFIVSQISGTRMKVHKYGKIADRILETNYALS
jgi:hypothetical protein